MLGYSPGYLCRPAEKRCDFFCRGEDGRLPPWFPPSADALVPRTLEDYATLFDAGAKHAVRLEFSVSYLWAPVARRIASAIPDCKLIAILRHPVDQARSWAEVQLGRPPTTNELATAAGLRGRHRRGDTARPPRPVSPRPPGVLPALPSAADLRPDVRGSDGETG